MKGCSLRRKILVVLMVVLALQLLMGATVALAAPPACGPYYVVRYGDTLFSIGRRYGVNPWAIARANGLWNPNYIRAGQTLYIPGGYYYPSYYPRYPYYPYYRSCYYYPCRWY